jgi:hypothetical protein
MSIRLEPSGKVQKPTAEELKAADENSGVLCLSKGVLDSGKPYFAYIAVKPSLFEEFYKRSSARETFVLDDYGIIIYMDELAEPPIEVQENMREFYGFDEDMPKKLLEELKKERAEYAGKQEEKRVMDIVAMLKAQKPQGNA